MNESRTVHRKITQY